MQVTEHTKHLGLLGANAGNRAPKAPGFAWDARGLGRGWDDMGIIAVLSAAQSPLLLLLGSWVEGTVPGGGGMASRFLRCGRYNNNAYVCPR